MIRLTAPAAIILLLTTSAFGVDPRVLKPGLIATYTDSTGRPTPLKVTRLESIPALGLAAGQTPDARMTVCEQVVWQGYLQIVTPGPYTFITELESGRIEVGLDKDGVKQSVLKGSASERNTVSGTATPLAAGVYRITVTLTLPTVSEQNAAANRSPARSFRLLWEGPGFRREPIPWFFFGHTAEDQKQAQIKEAQQQDFGRMLIEDRSCLSCHQPENRDLAKSLTPSNGPDLSEIGRRAFPGWLDAWLADPARLRTHTTMPRLFADDERGAAERYAMVRYLMTLGGPIDERRGKDDPQAARRGERLFTLTGCAACHANTPNESTRKRTDDDDPAPPYDPTGSFLGRGAPTGPQSTYSLGALGSKTTPERLAEYLRNPHGTHPNGRMPNMGLDGASSREIAQYLCRTTDGQISRRLRDEPKIKPAELDAGKVIRDLATLDNAKQWVEVGRQLFSTKGCVQCHQVKEKSAPVPSIPSWESVQKKRNAGCLAPDSKAGTHPSYPLTVGERDAIQTVLASVSSAEMIHRTTAPDPRHTLKRLMCLNCHSRDGEGGLAASLADRMKMLESAENADDVRPPSLTHIGHKATPEWLNSVLLKGGRARPWMGLRMPQYGAFHAASLVDGLAQLEGIHHTVPATKPTFDANLIAAGRTLTGKDGYGCITCHDIAGVAGGGTRGPDLALTFDRVRPEWFERWMHNPQRLSPGTKMPQYYIDGRAQNDVLGGDVSKQIHAIRAYLSLGPGLSLPVGMEPPKGLTITVTDRPVVLRTFMPEGAGTRPIAVGLPGGVNFAFDSTNGRLGYVWMGNFLDTSPVWNNRGGQPAKLLGARQWDAPNRIPWTVGSQPNFENVNPPDRVPVTNPAESAFHFDGYHVDRNGAPVFQSVLRGPTKPIKVSESISGLRNPLANGLSRTITWNSDDPIWFLAGETEGEPVIINTEGQRQTVKPKDGIVTVPVTGSRVVLPFAGNRAMLYDASTARLDAVWHFSPRPGGGWQLALKLPPSGPLTWSMWILPNNDERLIRELK